MSTFFFQALYGPKPTEFRGPARRRARSTAVYGLALFVLSFCLSSCGCGPTRDTAVEPAFIRLDLVEELATADVRTTRSRLRMADPAARKHLVRGFSFLEEDSGGAYLWAVGEIAEIEIFLSRPAEFQWLIHGRPFQPAGAPPLSAELRVNGTAVGSTELLGSQEKLSFQVPKGLTQAGENRLALHFSNPRRPVDWLDGARDDRPLTFQAYSFELDRLGDAPAPTRVAAGGSDEGSDIAELGVGSRISWFVDARPGEALAIRPQDGSSGDMEILAAISSVDGRRVVETVPGDQLFAVALDQFFEGAGDSQMLQVELLTRERKSLFGRWASEGSEGGQAVARVQIGVGPIQGAPPERSVVAGPELEGEPEVGGRGAAAQTPDILIYMIDTLRADRLGSYGSGLGLTPNWDRFAEDAVVFREFRAQTSWTRTAVASLMTGLYPQSHGVNDRDDGLAAAVPTLAEALGNAGYQTVGVVTNGNVGGRFGIGRGFDVYQHLRESRQRRDMHILSDQVDEWVGTWLTTLGPRPATRDRNRHAPFLLYAHVTDPHAPYTPHEPFLSRFAGSARTELGLLESVRKIDSRELAAGHEEAKDLLALYNAEVAFTDANFGLTINRLKELGLYDSMLIIVISDHGEEFYEHGDWEHGETLYDEQLRVPFIIKLPGNEGAGQVLDVRSGQVDVKPTVLDLLGLPGPEVIDGLSLLPAIRGLDSKGGAQTLAYLALENREKRSLIVDQLKLIGDSRSVDRLFALDADPGEQQDLAADRFFDKGYMLQRLRGLEWGLAARSQTADQVEIDPELRKQLEALGYIQ